MTGLPTATAGRLIQALQRGGFFIHHSSGSHRVQPPCTEAPRSPSIESRGSLSRRRHKAWNSAQHSSSGPLTVDELIALL